jgi:hypothetical protein
MDDMRHRLVKCGVLNLRQLWESEHVLKPKVPDWMYMALYHTVPRNSVWRLPKAASSNYSQHQTSKIT